MISVMATHSPAPLDASAPGTENHGMPPIKRRTVLAAIAGVATAPALSVGLDQLLLRAAEAADQYPSNTALYADPTLVEGIDYSRRYRRQAAIDDSDTTAYPFPETTIVAPHGGGIEPGTSELCLAVAGYHPATMEITPPDGPVYDHWMFEGLRSSNNSALHVTSTNCDDPVALALCGGAQHALSLHGCTTTQAGLPDATAAVLVGGLDTALKTRLINAFTAAGITAIDATGNPNLDGDGPTNIVNRTLTGTGAQLELTTPLRTAMFTTNTRAQRKYTTTEMFWRFVNATRTAITA
jgi:phage replication-related protein YjqB (UPF0714/DUF867 family)